MKENIIALVGDLQSCLDEHVGLPSDERHAGLKQNSIWTHSSTRVTFPEKWKTEVEEATVAYMQASRKQSKSWIVIALRIFSTLKQAVYDLRFTADRFR